MSGRVGRIGLRSETGVGERRCLTSLGRPVELAQRIVHVGAHVLPIASLSAFLLDRHVDLGPMHRNVRGRLNTEAYLPAIGRQHRDLDVVADHDALFGLTRQNEHTGQFADYSRLPPPLASLAGSAGLIALRRR